MQSILTVAKNVYLETESDGPFTCQYTGYGLFTLYNGKVIRRKLVDKKLYNEFRYVVRYKNKLLLIPFNIPSKNKV